MIKIDQSSSMVKIRHADHPVIDPVIESVVDQCRYINSSFNQRYFILILLLTECTSSHTWLSLLPIIERRRREFGHWNCTLPFAILSCCVPLWFNRQLNFLLIGSALCATPNTPEQSTFKILNKSINIAISLLIPLC